MESEAQHYRKLLREHGIHPTAQRVFMASFVLCKNQHLSAEYIFSNIGCMPGGRCLSKATIYNTLNLFTRKGLLQEVDVGDGKTYFDSNTSVHHHLYNVTTGEITDIPASMARCELPQLPAGTTLDSVNIRINIRSSEQ